MALSFKDSYTEQNFCSDSFSPHLSLTSSEGLELVAWFLINCFDQKVYWQVIPE